MGFSQIEEKLSKKEKLKKVIKEKRKGAVIFGCRAKKKLSEKWVARPRLYEK